MIEVNLQQAAYYNQSTDVRLSGKNTPSRIWAKLRNHFYHFREDIGIAQTTKELHERWLGNLSGKKVLDLGIGQGNTLSMSIALQCAEYHAIDLSERLAKTFDNKLSAAGLKYATSYRADFLSEEFAEKDFDVIYAMSVAHHFEDFDLFLETAQNKLKTGGKMITYDPLNTFFFSRIIRATFRPFQNDAAWEWPFNKKNFELIQKRFKLEGIQGNYGQSKWAFPLLFISKKMAVNYGRKAHQKDLKESNKIGAPLFRCLQVTMSMVKE